MVGLIILTPYGAPSLDRWGWGNRPLHWVVVVGSTAASATVLVKLPVDEESTRPVGTTKRNI